MKEKVKKKKIILRVIHHRKNPLESTHWTTIAVLVTNATDCAQHDTANTGTAEKTLVPLDYENEDVYNFACLIHLDENLLKQVTLTH
jgi:hypothetical protein